MESFVSLSNRHVVLTLQFFYHNSEYKLKNTKTSKNCYHLMTFPHLEYHHLPMSQGCNEMKGEENLLTSL